jgi:two-component system, OmpR family, catabolic regulation response regulator CreB
MELSSAATPCRIGPPEMAPETGTSVGRPIQVLLVEDSAEAAELVQVYLMDDESKTFRVEWACNLVDAMKRLAQPGLDVVLLDLGLPELNSYKSYRAIDVAAGPRIPVVILTSDDRSVSRDLTLGFGASDYLLKQESSPARLKQALRSAVMHSRPARTAGSETPV